MTTTAALDAKHPEYSKAAAGLRHPRIETLVAGEVLFRFASTKNFLTGQPTDSKDWARGAWWFREADYRKIIERFKAGRLGLGTVARSAGAVQPSWSNMDVSIKARLMRDVDAWVGAGATQYRDQLPNGMFVTLTGWPDIEQVYIPGMRGPAFSALQIVRQKVVSTDGFGFA